MLEQRIGFKVSKTGKSKKSKENVEVNEDIERIENIEGFMEEESSKNIEKDGSFLEGWKY